MFAIFVFFLFLIPLLIIAILLYPLLRFILKRITRENGKNITKLTIFLAIIGSPIVLAGAFIVHDIVYPSMRLDKPIGSEVVSSKQIIEYLSNEIQQFGGLTKYDLTVGQISMELDNEQRGKVEVIFVEKKEANRTLIFANLDTRKGMFYGFINYGVVDKLDPGTTHVQNWNIDSREAVNIARDFFSTNKSFRYDEIDEIYLISDPKKWFGCLRKKAGDSYVSYCFNINPYSGEISHSEIKCGFRPCNP